MAKRDETQIERILYELSFIIKVTKSIELEQFLKDDVMQHAVTMSLITIGECANHLSDEFIAAHTEIEWHKIIAVRNIAAHGYWQLNMKQIWQAIGSDVPQLEQYLSNLLI
jgi:uncharacterized protein with HEPN domain